jgi:alpha-N-acetylglucosamine transferase
MVNQLYKRRIILLCSIIYLTLISVGSRGFPASIDSFNSWNASQPEPKSALGPFSTIQSIKRILPESYNHSLGNVAYVTFLSTRNENDNYQDPYFNATRLLAYKLLHDPETKTTQGIPFLVMVTATVDQWKRDQLIEEGATVFEVDYINIGDNLKKGEPRWADQYTKLRLFQLTGFDRLLYIDSDMLIAKCLDGIFEDPAAFPGPSLDVVSLPEDELGSPDHYLIASIDDVLGENHPLPRPASLWFNAGFFILQPSIELFKKYIRTMEFSDRYTSYMMEQGLLNYVHRLNGNLPWKRLTPGKWCVTWPSFNDYNYGVASLHEKFWERGVPELRELWNLDLDKMDLFYSTATNIR